jgi:hypothetical protein
MITLPRLTATRYVQPLREGGSLPAVVDTNAGLFVAKFRGAGQGAKALLAELIVGLLARELELPVPELALIEVVPVFGQSEPDPEIQEVLRGSHGLNVGLRYLDGAFNFDSYAAGEFITPAFASTLVWFDAFLTNPDRTHRNPNLLIWDRKPWLIDHGSALYAHHAWATVDEERTRTPFPLIKDHVLLAHADDIEGADARLAARITPELVHDVLAAVPDVLLLDPISSDFPDAATARARYVDYLTGRCASPRAFVAQAVHARAARAAEPLKRRSARR